MGETPAGEQQDQRQPTERPAAGQPVVESLTVRLARAGDREAVFAFCARTWGDDGDYIPYVWDEWLADMAAGHGALLVAVASAQGEQVAQSSATAKPAQAERPVGLLHVRMVADDEAWIEGVRVDPTERRQGVGRSLVSRGLVAARERRATVARFFTDAENIASQRMFGGFGFTRVAELLAFRAPALTFGSASDDDASAATDASADATDTDGVDVSALSSPGALGATAAAAPQQATSAQTDDLAAQRTLAAAGLADDPGELRLITPGIEIADRIWEWLVQSNLTPFNGGLELRNWTARALTEANLRDYLTNGNVLLLEGWDTILALAITGEDTHAEDDEDTTDDDVGAAANDGPTAHDDSTTGAAERLDSDADGATATGDTGQPTPRRHAPSAGALNVRYLDGTADGLSRLCLALREVAGERGLARVNLWLPDLLILRDAMDGAGYERRGDEAMYVYARTL